MQDVLNDHVFSLGGRVSAPTCFFAHLDAIRRSFALVAQVLRLHEALPGERDEPLSLLVESLQRRHTDEILAHGAVRLDHGTVLELLRVAGNELFHLEVQTLSLLFDVVPRRRRLFDFLIDAVQLLLPDIPNSCRG